MKYFLVWHVLSRLSNHSLLVDKGQMCQGSPRYFFSGTLCNSKCNEQKEISLHINLHEQFFGQACPTTSFKPQFISESRLEVSGESKIISFQVQFVILSLVNRKKFLCILLSMKYILIWHVLSRLLNHSSLVDQGGVRGAPDTFFQVHFVILSLMNRKKFLCILVFMKFFFLVRHILSCLLNHNLLVDQGCRCLESPSYLFFRWAHLLILSLMNRQKFLYILVFMKFFFGQACPITSFKQ